jgi:nucleotide-binding universal stress UspA family protein
MAQARNGRKQEEGIDTHDTTADRRLAIWPSVAEVAGLWPKRQGAKLWRVRLRASSGILSQSALLAGRLKLNGGDAMFPIRRILVATDFSQCADRALQLACEMANRFGAELHLLHVQKDSLPYHGYDFEYPAELQQQLDSRPGPPWQQQLDVTRSVRVGPPALEIVADAQERGADMIVLGAHGLSPIRDLILGSVAERVVRTATCPVLTVRHVATREPRVPT